MILGQWLDLWIDRKGWIMIAIVTAAAVMIFGGALKSPVMAFLSYVMLPFLIFLVAALGEHG